MLVSWCGVPSRPRRLASISFPTTILMRAPQPYLVSLTPSAQLIAPCFSCLPPSQPSTPPTTPLSRVLR